MKIHRFIGDFKLKVGVINLEDKELFNQLRNVLKLRVGEHIILGDGEMNEGIGEIKKYNRNIVEIEITEIRQNKNESERKVILYCAILKKENFELVVQKATEIGVKEIVPLITARTVKLDIRKDRIEKIIKESAEQSGRGILPILHDPISFENAVKLAKSNKLNLFFDPSGIIIHNSHSSLSLRAHPPESKTKFIIQNSSIGAWVGPEGGWTPAELKQAKDKDFKILSLGKTTLRAETAAITGIYLVISGYPQQLIPPVK